jgi:predicted transposase/invertase (TIGR01784 family)
MTQYLSPRNDYGFKKLFGSKDHTNLTMSFLNAILGRTQGNLITHITFRQTEKIPEPAGGRRSFLDVYCVDQNDHHFIIEMQNEPQDSFFERMIYYASLVYSRQRPNPFQYERLVPVIFIGILTQKLNDDHPEVISEHAIMNTKHNSISSRHMMYYLVELGKFNKAENQLETDIDKWLYFMKKADSCKEIPSAFRQDAEFITAFEILKQMAFSETDLFNYLAAADAEGREERIEKAAIKKNTRAMALKLLQKNTPIEEIAELTELSIEEIKNLEKK